MPGQVSGTMALRTQAAVAPNVVPVPEYKCTLRADERSRMFQAGYRFPEQMSYKELCQFVSKESNKAGFDPLRPRVHNLNRTLDYVTFYCVHSRDHGDQSREALGKPEATSKRANRREEGTMCMYTSCEFSVRIQRCREANLPLYATMSKEEVKVMKSNMKFDWYMDSPVPSPAQILAKVQQMNAAVSGVANKKAAKKPQFCTCGGAENLSRTEKCCPYCEQFNLD